MKEMGGGSIWLGDQLGIPVPYFSRRVDFYKIACPLFTITAIYAKYI